MSVPRKHIKALVGQDVYWRTWTGREGTGKLLGVKDKALKLEVGRKYRGQKPPLLSALQELRVNDE